MAEPNSLVVLACSRRKRRTSRLIPTIDRYDAPMFRVFRKHRAASPLAKGGQSGVTLRPARPHSEPRPSGSGPSPPRGDIPAYVLSARFGLIPGEQPIPRYEYAAAPDDNAIRR